MIGLGAGIVAARRLGPSPWLGVGLALGGASLATYAWLLLGAGSRLGLLGLEAGLLAAAFLLPRHAAPASVGAAPAGAGAISRALVVAALLVLAVGLGVAVTRFPDGAWDAVDIWNARARALVRADLATALDGAKHPDYPLLLPLAVAHGWTWLGESRAVPVAIAVAFALGSAGLLHAAARAQAGAAAGRVVLVLLVASPTFAVFGATQRADVPLGYFMLGAAWLLALSVSRRDGRLLPLAGALLGCAAWLKNEGLLFALVAGVAWLAAAGPARREAWRIAAGAAPFALVLVHHKLTCGATTDLLALQDASSWRQLLEPGRYARIAAAFAVSGAPLVAAWLAAAFGLGALRRTADPAARLLLRATLWMLAGYAAVYLLTPRDLAWHLGSSLDRLLQQLWPLSLLALAYRVPLAGPAEAPSAALPLRT